MAIAKLASSLNIFDVLLIPTWTCSNRSST